MLATNGYEYSLIELDLHSVSHSIIVSFRHQHFRTHTFKTTLFLAFCHRKHLYLWEWVFERLCHHFLVYSSKNVLYCNPDPGNARNSTMTSQQYTNWPGYPWQWQQVHYCRLGNTHCLLKSVLFPPMQNSCEIYGDYSLRQKIYITTGIIYVAHLSVYMWL